MVSRMNVLVAVLLVSSGIVGLHSLASDGREALTRGLLKQGYVGENTGGIKKDVPDGTMESVETRGAVGIGLLRLEVALVALMLGIAIFMVTYGFNAKRALDKAAKLQLADITALVREHIDKELATCDKKASESAQKSYASAMRAIQAFFTSIDVGEARGTPEELNEMKRRLMVTGSLLQIEYGESEEVITGANNVYQLAPIAARSALAEGLKREDLSLEARETLELRLRDLVKQAVV